eukprot:11363384-Karenia_brevis.AAC.1
MSNGDRARQSGMSIVTGSSADRTHDERRNTDPAGIQEDALELSQSALSHQSGTSSEAHGDLNTKKGKRKSKAKTKQKPLSQWFSPKSGTTNASSTYVDASLPGDAARGGIAEEDDFGRCPE